MDDARLNPHERMCLDNADYFTAVAYRGGSCYERIECPDRETARATAKKMISNRGAMVYAVYRSHFALVDSFH